MKEKTYVCNLVLAALWGLVLAVFVVCRALFPGVILPAWDIPLLLAVSLVSLLIDHWAAPAAGRSWGLTALLALLTFGLLPLCAGLADAMTALKLAVAGGVTYTVAAVLFGSILDRLSSGPSAKGAPVAAAFVLFLAGQCFTNIFF